MGRAFRKEIVIIAALAVCASCLFIFFLSYPLSGHDERQYDRLGYNLARNGAFSLEETAPFAPTMFRDPGYPAFLAASYAVFGHRIKAVLLLQMIMHALTAVLAYSIAKSIFTESSAFLAGVLAAVFPTLANMSGYLLSETFFTFALSLGVYAHMKGLKSRSVAWCAFAGLVFGAATLTKAAALLLPVFLAGIAVVTAVLTGKEMKRLCICLLVLLIIPAALASAWMMRNKAEFNTYSITLRGGEALWSRAEKLDDGPKEVLITACYNFSEFLGQKLFPGAAERPERYLFKDFEKAEALRVRYAASGQTDPQIEEIFKREAMHKISRQPLKYIAYTFIEGIKMTAFTYIPVLNEPAVCEYFGKLRNGDIVLSVLKGIMRMAAYVLIALFLAGAVRNARIWDSWMPLFAAVLYFTLIYSLLDAIGRYSIPLIPFYCIMAAAAIFPVKKNPAI
jgi:hypothetical protein